MSNPWTALMPFPSGAPDDGTGIVIADLTQYPFTWSMEEMTIIEWMWKKSVVTLSGGSVTVTDFTGSRSYDIADPPLTRESDVAATNWRELVPGPGFPPPRGFGANMTTLIPVTVIGVSADVVLEVSCSLSGLWMLPGGTHTCTKSLQMSVSANLSVGSGSAFCGVDNFGGFGTVVSGTWTAFGRPVSFANGDGTRDGAPFTLKWGTLPTLTFEAPEPFLPAPGPLG
jgi:hypothetical protein